MLSSSWKKNFHFAVKQCKYLLTMFVKSCSLILTAANTALFLSSPESTKGIQISHTQEFIKCCAHQKMENKRVFWLESYSLACPREVLSRVAGFAKVTKSIQKKTKMPV
jgi:hypothetical protein